MYAGGGWDIAHTIEVLFNSQTRSGWAAVRIQEHCVRFLPNDCSLSYRRRYLTRSVSPSHP